MLEFYNSVTRCLVTVTRPTKRSGGLPVIFQVLTTLRFSATGSFYIVIGDGMLLSASSMCRVMWSVVDASQQHFNQIVKYPRRTIWALPCGNFIPRHVRFTPSAPPSVHRVFELASAFSCELFMKINHDVYIIYVLT